MWRVFTSYRVLHPTLLRTLRLRIPQHPKMVMHALTPMGSNINSEPSDLRESQPLIQRPRPAVHVAGRIQEDRDAVTVRVLCQHLAKQHGGDALSLVGLQGANVVKEPVWPPAREDLLLHAVQLLPHLYEEGPVEAWHEAGVVLLVLLLDLLHTCEVITEVSQSSLILNEPDMICSIASWPVTCIQSLPRPSWEPGRASWRG